MSSTDTAQPERIRQALAAERDDRRSHIRPRCSPESSDTVDRVLTSPSSNDTAPDRATTNHRCRTTASRPVLHPRHGASVPLEPGSADPRHPPHPSSTAGHQHRTSVFDQRPSRNEPIPKQSVSAAGVARPATDAAAAGRNGRARDHVKSRWRLRDRQYETSTCRSAHLRDQCPAGPGMRRVTDNRCSSPCGRGYRHLPDGRVTRTSTAMAPTTRWLPWIARSPQVETWPPRTSPSERSVPTGRDNSGQPSTASGRGSKGPRSSSSAPNTFVPTLWVPETGSWLVRRRFGIRG